MQIFSYKINLPTYDELKEYWLLISLLTGSAGYLMKVWIDSVVKKKQTKLENDFRQQVVGIENDFKRNQIKYDFFLKNRMKTIESFLSNYAQLFLNFRDISQTYLNKRIDAKGVDDIIVPLRYKLTDSLSQVQLYLSQNEFKEFNDIHDNMLQLIGAVSRLHFDVTKEKIDKDYILSDLVAETKFKNDFWIKTIVSRIQLDMLDPINEKNEF